MKYQRCVAGSQFVEFIGDDDKRAVRTLAARGGKDAGAQDEQSQEPAGVV